MMAGKKLQGLWIMILVVLMGLRCSTVSATLVETRKSERGWELYVNNIPYFIQGMCYFPDTIGESSNDNTRRNWEVVDDDNDGRNDFAYQTRVDANRNNKSDWYEHEAGDFKLMQEMGVNTIRIYHHVSDDPALQVLNRSSSRILNYSPDAERKILRELYSKFGIMSAMGDFLGAYTVATGADWSTGTDYTDPAQKANMLKSVEAMVRQYKDEPYILMWILGNENDLSYPHTQASRQPEAYARFVNEAAALIKKLDDHRHPVALCSGSDALIGDYARFAPEVDIFGLNRYGDNGFYELWKKLARDFDRPVVLTEFGTGHPFVSNGELNEDIQARVHRRSWEDIVRHSAGHESPGNAIGGFVFEWADNWWEDGDQWHQNVNPDKSGWNHEYNGMTSFGDGSAGSLSRQLRKVYSMYKEIWGH